jgi:hypothetical protein
MHNTQMSLFIPPAGMQKSAGTWTPTLATHLTSDVRTANASAFTAIIPIPLPGNSAYRQGACLKSVTLYYKIATADASDFAVAALKKKVLAAHGAAVSGADLSVTLDSNHDTAAKRKAQGDHTLTLTLSTPVFLDAAAACELVITVDCAAGTVFSLFGARASYELRLG